MGGRGRPAPTHIVDIQDLMAQRSIRAEVHRYQSLMFNETLDCIRWLAKRRLLRNSVLCQIPMSFVRKMDLTDGYRWKCKTCSRVISIRNDSFFSGSHLSLQQILLIIYGWAKDYAQKDIAHEAKLGQHSTHTKVAWCAFCRDVCEQYLIDNPQVIGGLNDDMTAKVVEIDESKFFHRKYHRGQWRAGHWVFGGIERNTKKCFLVEVPDRTAETLSNLIQRYVYQKLAIH
jgi:hypothetical protein